MIAIILMQVVYFVFIVREKTFIKNADLIVIFPAEVERLAAGLQLAREGYASNLIATGLTEKTFRSYLNKYGDIPASVKPIISGKSNTTFEDALITRRILQQQNLKSVILVTSAYHLPRAYFLLRVMVTGLDVRIQRYGVDQGRHQRTILKLQHETSNAHRGKSIIAQKDANIGQRTGVLELKLICNEMIKFWTSLGEMVSYKITGKLPADIPLLLWIRNILKSKVLFVVH